MGEINKKIIILVMGTNEKTDPFFRQEYEECCKKTWIKNLPSNFRVIYYQGGEKTELKDDILTVACEDDLKNTYKKTYFALDYIDKNFDYDIIFRTNTSTYINGYLLNLFINNIYEEDYFYGSEIYSLSEAYCPYPLFLYRRGNGIIYNKNEVKNILIEGINLLYLGHTDDIALDNVLNSINIKHYLKIGEKYLDNHRGIPHAWYKSVDNKFDSRHALSSYNKSKYYWMCPTVTIKRYRKRDEEFDIYKEFHGIIENIEYPDEKEIIEKMKSYSLDFSIFVGSILGYFNYSKWKTFDKNRLYLLEISSKATDDEQFNIRKEIQGKFNNFDLNRL